MTHIKMPETHVTTFCTCVLDDELIMLKSSIKCLFCSVPFISMALVVFSSIGHGYLCFIASWPTKHGSRGHQEGDAPRSENLHKVNEA